MLVFQPIFFFRIFSELFWNGILLSTSLDLAVHHKLAILCLNKIKVVNLIGYF